MNRYDRQIRLPEIGREGQEKLLTSSVLCVGAGGLGSPALLYLAAAGVGRIGIIDFDRVDESNLQRQILYSNAAVGQLKATQSADRLSALNPAIQIDAYNEELNAESAARLFPVYDIILDGTDNFEAKFLINDAAVKYGKTWIYGAIQGFDGQASVFNYKGGPCYRCLYPEKPSQPVMNCAEAGVIGAVAGIVGVTQALQAIQIIAGHPSFEILSGRLWRVDTRTMHTQILNIQKNRACVICSREPNAIVPQYASPVCGAVSEISVRRVKNKVNYVLIDVREQEEWDKGSIKGAILWPLSKIIAGHMPESYRGEEIILHCQKGKRSMQAVDILRAHGFADVKSLSGGYEAWLEDAQ